MYITFRWPIVFTPNWKRNMIIYAQNGEPIKALKALKEGKNLTLLQAKNLWESKYRDKYFKSKL